MMIQLTLYSDIYLPFHNSFAYAIPIAFSKGGQSFIIPHECVVNVELFRVDL